MSPGSSFLAAHRATLTPNGQGWWLLYPVAALSVDDRGQESIDLRLAIAATSYDDALELVELILRAHKPPDVASPQANCHACQEAYRLPRPWRSRCFDPSPPDRTDDVSGSRPDSRYYSGIVDAIMLGIWPGIGERPSR